MIEMQWTVPAKLAGHILDFQKATFNNSFEAMVLLQSQAARAAVSMGYSWGFPESGQQLIDEWIKAFNQAREQYQQMVIQGFDDLERMLVREKQQKEAPKAKTTSAKTVEVKTAAPAKPAKKEQSEKPKPAKQDAAKTNSSD